MNPELLQYSSSKACNEILPTTSVTQFLLQFSADVGAARNISCRIVLPHCKHNLITSVTSPETRLDHRSPVPLNTALFNPVHVSNYAYPTTFSTRSNRSGHRYNQSNPRLVLLITFRRNSIRYESPFVNRVRVSRGHEISYPSSDENCICIYKYRFF